MTTPIFGSVVGDHVGSGQVARVGGGGRALVMVFDTVTPAATGVAATPAALAAAATTTAAAAAPATPGVAVAVTTASVAAVTTTAPPTAPTFPSKPAPHEVAFLPADTTPVHKIFPARNSPRQHGQGPAVPVPSAWNGPGQPGQGPAVPVPSLPPMQGAATLPGANAAPNVITEAGYCQCRKLGCGQVNHLACWTCSGPKAHHRPIYQRGSTRREPIGAARDTIQSTMFFPAAAQELHMQRA